MTNYQIFEWCKNNLSEGMALYDVDVFISTGMYRSCEQWFGSQLHTYCDYFLFCNRDIERQMAITQANELVASSHYRSGQGHSHYVFNKTLIHFENEAMLQQFQWQEPIQDSFNPWKGTSPDGLTNYQIVKWQNEISNHLKGNTQCQQ